MFNSLIISPLFVPSIFLSHPLLSVSYHRKLNWNIKSLVSWPSPILQFTVHGVCIVPWRFQTVSCHIHLQVPYSPVHRSDTWSESLTVEWHMYDKLMLLTDCCMNNQYSTAWLVTNVTTDSSVVERILVMKWDWENRNKYQKHRHWINLKCKVLFRSKNIG